MEGLQLIFILVFTFYIYCADAEKRYKDLFQDSHNNKFPLMPGWSPDTNPWDDSLYPPFKSSQLERRRRKSVIAHLTSDSPAMNGSSITFTTTLEFPKCQREDANGNLVYDPNCADESGQVRSGYVYNWTSWLDDYGYGTCADPAKCNVFPDGVPFPQTNDWRRKNYVYVWHTMGQYFQTCGGRSSSIKLNTTNITLGAEIMEVMVYHAHDRRKYRPSATADGVYYVTDKIPLAVNVSQNAARHMPKGVFIKNLDIVFKVLIHDPSSYLKTADFVDFMWDFSDGNRLVTHSNVATHAYSLIGNVTVKLIVEAAFRIACPPAMPTTTAKPTSTPTGISTDVMTSSSATPAASGPTEATSDPTTATPCHTTGPAAMTTGHLTTEPLPTTAESTTSMNVTSKAPLTSQTECFRYMYGYFEEQIFIVDGIPAANDMKGSQIVDVSAAKENSTTINFHVRCLGSTPTSACTIISDVTCRQVMDIFCDDVAPSADCQVTVRHTFAQPGTYCVNITLLDSTNLMLASTRITVGNGMNAYTKAPATPVVLSASAVLLAVFAFVAFLMYRRYRVYQPVRYTSAEWRSGRQAGEHLNRLRVGLLPQSDEKRHLLTNGHSP